MKGIEELQLGIEHCMIHRSIVPIQLVDQNTDNHSNLERNFHRNTVDIILRNKLQKQERNEEKEKEKEKEEEEKEKEKLQ